MTDAPEFSEIQRRFAAHIRDPEHVEAPPGIEDRRMALYRNLFFNNLRNLLSSTFPVLRKLYDDKRWAHLVREFMRQHRSRTPYFLELPAEFLSFLESEYVPDGDDLPFLVELAHYEYIELAVSIATEDNLDADVDPQGDLLEQVPVRSALCWAYEYRYPVHRISPTFLPDAPGEMPVYLAVYRNSEDKVVFVELSPVNFMLLEAIGENPAHLCGRELLIQLAQRSAYPDQAQFIHYGGTALAEMRQQQLLTGTRRKDESR